MKEEVKELKPCLVEILPLSDGQTDRLPDNVDREEQNQHYPGQVCSVHLVGTLTLDLVVHNKPVIGILFYGGTEISKQCSAVHREDN